MSATTSASSLCLRCGLQISGFAVPSARWIPATTSATLNERPLPRFSVHILHGSVHPLNQVMIFGKNNYSARSFCYYFIHIKS